MPAPAQPADRENMHLLLTRPWPEADEAPWDGYYLLRGCIYAGNTTNRKNPYLKTPPPSVSIRCPPADLPEIRVRPVGLNEF